MVDTSTQPSLGYMELVPDRTAQTLLPIIQAHTQSGTIVWSDEWRAYRRVSTLSTVQCHQTVNHSVEFVSPQGVHTQAIESYWARAKYKLKKMKGCSEEQLPSYLDEFMWRERKGKTKKDAYIAICQEIASQYPV